VSSAPGELTPERDAVKSAIRSLRLEPVLHDLGTGPDLDQADPAGCDAFVGIYWRSYGWQEGEGEASDIERELEEAAGVPRLLYVKEPAPDRDPALGELLQRMGKDTSARVTVFEAPGDLAEMLVADLGELIASSGAPSDVALPEGTLTFMFCDIEGSTTLLRDLGAEYPMLLAEYHKVVSEEAHTRGGLIADIDGDRAFLVFPDADQAVEAAIGIQTSLATGRWEASATARCRIGLHTGTAVMGSLGYVGLDVHRAARIASAAHGGQILVSAAVKALTEGGDRSLGWSMNELGSYALKGLSRAERLFQVMAPGLGSTFPPPRARSSAPVRLPASHGALVGRERETREVAALLARQDVHLVTLTGPAGVGKTRVALASAEELSESFPDGVYFVSLATLAEPENLASIIGEAAGIPIEGDAFASVSDAFQHQQVLLVLDNFEQVVEAAPVIGSLLDTSPGLKALITSRVVLRIGGEHEYTVDALPTPAEDASDHELIGASPAVQLFVDRAEHVTPGFRLSPDNAMSVARITRLVEGLPLAVELAAARLRTLSPAALADRLGGSLEVLGKGAADLPDRQRTLEAAIDWSFRLLTEQEQRLFARLGVFTGGFTIDSAQEVGIGPDGGDALDLLASLVDNSMILPVQGGSGRMRMLAPIREFSLARLGSSGELEPTRERHARYFMHLSEAQAPALRDVGQAAALETLHDEWPNLETAAAWLGSTGHWDGLVRIAQVMWVYVWIGNRIPEARSWLLDFPQPTPSLDRRLEGHYWWLLGGTGYEMGDYEASKRAIDIAIPILEESGDEEVLAWARFIGGLLLPAFGTDPQEVMASLDDALRRFRDIGDRWGEGYALIGYGILAAASGDFATAESYHLQCRSLGEALANDVLIGHAETQLGFTYLASGQGDRAREALRRAVDKFRPLRYREGICYALEAMAALAFGEDRTELGMIALGAAEGVRDKIALRPWPAVMWFFDMLAAMADALEDPRLQAARLAGRQMSPFDAVDLVLGDPVEMAARAAS
jgi:predicted ATPase/class 3 adenylate cyclase